MTGTREGFTGLDIEPAEAVISELMAELGRAFDLTTRIGDRLLGEAVEGRLRSLEVSGTPDWGTDGSFAQVAKKGTGALDFYYRPHLFPGMDPALRLGHHLQFDLLPRRLPAASPLRIAAVLESYCHLSGDLLGWRMEGDELFLWIADVSGHGVRAGLAAAVLYFVIDEVEEGLPPEVFADRINSGMRAARNPHDSGVLFATAVWLRAAADGALRYASAGHHPLLWLRSTGEVETLESTGRPLGLFAGESYGGEELRLGEGDVVCLFTDGLVEATSPAGEELGNQRIVDLRRQGSQSPIDLARAIYQTAREHQGTNLLEDDLTFMVVEPAAPTGRPPGDGFGPRTAGRRGPPP